MQQKCLLLLLLSGLTVLPAFPQASEQEASLKAAFIYNFTRYTEWDEKNNTGIFIIGIIGSSTLDFPLEKIAETNTVNGKKIFIKHYTTTESIDFCHILFIPKNAAVPLPLILAKTGKGTLTISEEAGYAKMGCAFNFIIKNEKLKFEVNLKSVYNADIKVSSQLLKLAIIID